MADSGVLEGSEESELDVLPHFQEDDKGSLTFSASNSHELLVDVNEVGLSLLFSFTNFVVIHSVQM